MKNFRLNNTAKEFWIDLLKVFTEMGCGRRNADPCIYLKWKAIVLLVWLSLIYYCECFGRDDEVEKSRNEIMKLFDCDDVGNME